MINPDNETLHAFYTISEWDGFKRLCEQEVRKAVSALKDILPNDTIAIAKLQERIRVFEKDIPSVKTAVENYAAKAAIPALTGG